MNPRPDRRQHLMAIAHEVAKRSTCQRVPQGVGAVIAIQSRIVSTGYAGAPSGHAHCNESCDLSRPCTRTVHAEANALVFAARHGIAVEGASLYTTLSPCVECAKLIVNAGIVEAIFGEFYRNNDGLDLLRRSGLSVVGPC